jgi:hypothetical protein
MELVTVMYHEKSLSFENQIINMSLKRSLEELLSKGRARTIFFRPAATGRKLSDMTLTERDALLDEAMTKKK